MAFFRTLIIILENDILNIILTNIKKEEQLIIFSHLHSLNNS